MKKGIGNGRGRGSTAKKDRDMMKIDGAISKRRAPLLKKASELSLLCDAQIAVILISADTEMFEFASSDTKSILKRLDEGMKCLDCPAKKLKSKDNALSQSTEAPSLKKRKLLGKDLAQMGVRELLALEEELSKGMLCNKDRKSQILKEQLERSKMQEEQALQRNLSLRKMVEDLQGVFPSNVCPAPLSVHFPETEGNADTKSLQSTSYAAPLAMFPAPFSFHFPETEGNADTKFLPSTNYAGPLTLYPMPLSVRSETEGNAEGNADTRSLSLLSFSAPFPIRFPETEGDADTRSLPSTSHAAPLSVTEGNADTRLLPSTSHAAPLPVNCSETEGNADTRSLPSTSHAAPLATDNGPETESTAKPAYEDWGATLSLGRS